MFRIKICGITNVDDALDAAAAGADAIGLNFYQRSKRFINVSTAERICDSLPDGMKKVGVFVNATEGEIAQIATQVELSGIQLHGDEGPELLSQLPQHASIVRAFRCGAQGLAPLRDYLEACRSHGRIPDALLLDADAQTEFGGTGRAADWTRIASERDWFEGFPIILGGGLTPANVGAAIAQVRPTGVDVASGVERAPGKKDAALIRRFVTAAREAFASLR